MKKVGIILVGVMLLVGLMATGGLAQKNVTLRVCWAAWEPADLLIALSKDFTEKTGVVVKGAFVPWPQYHDKVFSEFAAHGSGFDLLLPDSQWMGEAVTGGHLVELTDWIKENINLDEFYEFPAKAYGEYPDNSGHWYAVPAEQDFCAIVYRKDLFNDPKEKANFKKKYGYDLDIPKTLDEYLDIVRFFTRPKENLYGFVACQAPIATGGVIDNFLWVLWSMGGALWDPRTKHVEGILNNQIGIDAAKYWLELSKCSPPGTLNTSLDGVITSVQQGLAVTGLCYPGWAAGMLDPKKSKVWDKIAFCATPGAVGKDGIFRHYTQLGGQGLAVSAYSKHKKEALEFIKWFISDEVQLKWAKGGGFSPKKSIVQRKDFLSFSPYNKAAQETYPYLRDFWHIPEYAEMGEYASQQLNEAVAGRISASEAMDKIAKRHEQILKRGGYYR